MNPENEGAPVFREVQRFRQVWVWAVVLALSGLMWYAAVVQLVFRRPFGTNPMPDGVLIVFWLLFGAGMPALFLYTRLITEVRRDGVYLRYLPFHRRFRKIAFEDIKDYEVQTYRPLRDYGGWGIRYGAKGKAYNVSGNQGVQLEFVKGGRLLIGSQRPQELWQAIRAGAGRR